MSDSPSGSGAPEPAHPSTALDEVVHQRSRLGILTVLAESGRADFPYLKSILRLTDGNLGRHLEILAAEGLITITKGYEGRRPRTWAEITKKGEASLTAQVEAMRELVKRFESRQLLDAETGARRGRERARRAVPGLSPM
jgi:DNA-binding MarR family transcriptional regulator